MSAFSIVLGVALGLIAGAAGLVLHLRRRARRVEQPTSATRAAKGAWRGVNVTSTEPPPKLAGLTLASALEDTIGKIRDGVRHAARTPADADADADSDLDEGLEIAREIVSSLAASGVFPTGLAEHTLADLARRVIAQHAELAELRGIAACVMVGSGQPMQIVDGCVHMRESELALLRTRLEVAERGLGAANERWVRIQPLIRAVDAWENATGYAVDRRNGNLSDAFEAWQQAESVALAGRGQEHIE